MKAGLMDKEQNTAAPEYSAFVKKPAYSFFKRTADILLSFIASLILLIPCAVIALLILTEDGGPVIYAHSRVGKDGRPIKVYKFRSMKRDADNMEKYLTPVQQEEFKKEYKLKNDPRVTRIGRVLRRTSLDELPQIFMNVLILGNMSVVGPRPVVNEETMLYGDDREALLSVKPGLTGYWAAYADKNTSYENGSRQKMELYYVTHRSVLFDLKIIFKTAETVIRKAFYTNNQ
ncbi:MAG: sugar transferase [Huintestinicola sp.]|uniref:sugar transferase n=1 Tax=Huintestinicola sp. TaxID=2981661 RepID=UPI003F125D54